MSRTPPKPARVRPWAVHSPLAAKRHRLDRLDAEGHHGDGNDLAAARASSLAARFHRATSSAAEEQNEGGEDMALAWVPTPTPAPPLPLPTAFVPAPAPAPAPTKHRRLDSAGSAEDEDQPMTQCCRLVLRPPRPPPPVQQGQDATEDVAVLPAVLAPVPTNRHWLNGSGAGDEDQPATWCCRIVLRPPHPPSQAQLCQPGGSDNGGASGLGNIDAAFQDCFCMSPLDGDLGGVAEAALLPKPSLGLQASLATLEAETQAACLALTKQVQGDKSTGITYQRHVDSYEKWWLRYQAQRRDDDAKWTAIPAFPITASKVAEFLQYECTHEKVCFPLSLTFSLSTEQLKKTEVKGGQAHHTPLSCWQGGHIADNICP
jgi:hypothetical protein